MDAVVLGLVFVAVGAVVAAFGYRLFYIALAVFSFVAGFLAGGQVIHAWLGEGLFSTVLGWTAGLVTGALLAGLAVGWFWIGVVVAVGAVAAALAEAVLVALGLGGGLLAFAVWVVVGIGAGVLAVRLDAPTVVIAGACAVGGTAFAFAGAFLVTGAMTPQELADGPLAPFETRPLAFVLWGFLAVAAWAWQVRGATRSGLGPSLGHGARPAATPAVADATAGADLGA